MEGLIAAVRCGADAVYAGGKTFSARAGAKNFDDAELSDAVRYCHLHGVKIYRAMNTAVFDSEIKSVADEIMDICMHSYTDAEPRKVIHYLLCQRYGTRIGAQYYRKAVKYADIA